MSRVVIAALVAVPLLVGAGALFARGSGSEQALIGPGPGRYKGSEPPGRIMLPSFALEEWDGTTLRSGALHGKVVLVTFLETKCKEACPIIADQIDLALARLSPPERRRVEAVAVSTHPGDDTPASVRKFLRVHRVVGELHYLIGTEARLRPVWRSFQIMAALDSGDADTHSAPVRIFNRDGVWVSTLHPAVDLTPTNLAHDVRVALRSS